MLTLPRHLWRAFVVARTLARHGAILFVDEFPIPLWLRRLIKWVNNDKAPGRPGERLARALIELGPIFVKLGQSLGTRADLVGQQVAEDLATLHDDLPPFPGDQAVRTIEQDFELPLDALFQCFEREPVAAASIAQVHRAVATDGREVAVKVLRPGVERRIENELRFLAFMAFLAEHLVPLSDRLHPEAAVRVFAETTRRELDMRLEAAACDEFRENNLDAHKFRVPAVDWQRTAKRVLTIEWVQGIASDEPERLRASAIDPAEVLETASRVFFRQVFVHGFFHGDMHPGNVFIQPDGTIIPVDYGIMGRLDLPTRLFLGEMLVVFLDRDYMRLAGVLVKGGLVPDHVDRGALSQALRAMAEPIMGLPQNEISIGRLLGQLFEVAGTFEMRARPDLLLLQKTMLVAEGVGRALNPSVNMWQLAQPLVEDWIAGHLGAAGAARKIAGDTRDMLERLPRLLREADTVLAMAQDGHKRRQRRRWPQRLAWIAVGAAMGALLI